MPTWFLRPVFIFGGAIPNRLDVVSARIKIRNGCCKTYYAMYRFVKQLNTKSGSWSHVFNNANTNIWHWTRSSYSDGGGGFHSNLGSEKGYPEALRGFTVPPGRDSTSNYDSNASFHALSNYARHSKPDIMLKASLNKWTNKKLRHDPEPVPTTPILTTCILTYYKKLILKHPCSGYKIQNTLHM
jgi:hypothetical protein